MQNIKHVHIKSLALEVIQSFPKARNGQPFLTLKNGRKLFFSIFIKKYGLDGDPCKYNDLDVSRRIRLVEFFDYFVKDYALENEISNTTKYPKYKIRSTFHQMIVIDVGENNQSKFELLSFYPYK